MKFVFRLLTVPVTDIKVTIGRLKLYLVSLEIVSEVVAVKLNEVTSVPAVLSNEAEIL